MTQLTHPLNVIPADKRARVFVALLIVTLLMTFAFRFIGPEQPTIVDFELAGSVANAQAIIDAWAETDRIRAGFSLGFDYLYMPVYSTTIALACILAVGVLRKRTWHRSGLLLAWGLGVAALFDATENLALFTELLGNNVAPYPHVAQICALIKFGLIVLGLLYVVGGVILRLFKK